jgi:hypothetical protein
MKAVVLCVIVALIVSTMAVPTLAGKNWFDRFLDWLEVRVSRYQLGPAVSMLLSAPLITLSGSGIGGGTPRAPLVGPGDMFTAD